jgi:hemerythrin
MSLMTWSPTLSVNVKQFDDQHIKLVNMLNELYDASKEGKGKEVLGKVLNDLIDYSASHFIDEERLMVEHAYPDMAHHKAIHDNLVKQVIELQQKFTSGQAILTLDVMMFLKDWLVTHIQVTDKKYSAYLNSKGIY